MRKRRSTVHESGHQRVVVLFLAALAALSLLLLPAPAVGQEAKEGAEQHERAVSHDAPITVVVRNHNWADMKIYAVSGSREWRLGTATSMNDTEIEVPRHLQADVAGLELVAIPIGGHGAASTGSLLVMPGDQVGWIIENHLNLSSVFIG